MLSEGWAHECSDWMEGDTLSVTFIREDDGCNPGVSLEWEGDGCLSRMVFGMDDLEWLIEHLTKARDRWRYGPSLSRPIAKSE